MPISIWWIRRDLRLVDNQALRAAFSVGNSVLPLFILDPTLIHKSGPRRLAFLIEGLKSLNADLDRCGANLVVREGSPLEQLAQVVQECGAEQIFVEEDYSPYARRRDSQVAASLPLNLVSGAAIHPPAALVKRDGTPYKVFTPFSKAWQALPFPARPAPDPQPIFSKIPEQKSIPLPASSGIDSFPAGEAEAFRRLLAFTNGPIFQYSDGRDRLDLPGTARLSPYLRFGMLSARQAAWAGLDAARRAPALEARSACETWLNELVWREFYNSILYHFPHVLKEAFNPSFRKISWRSDPDGLRAWQQGLTGYPVVDACMRELLASGWMHNRGRMIVASFLVKDLNIDWRAGEAWFMQQLIDADPAANNGGWQWCAGVGTDAAPYFRILNPVSQSKKCDPQGQFIRQWLPEMADVPLEYIHEPWLMSPDLQSSAHCRIGKDYPAPIVDHRAARERTINLYQEKK